MNLELCFELCRNFARISLVLAVLTSQSELSLRVSLSLAVHLRTVQEPFNEVTSH